jgi:hypothetical protein
VGHVASLAVSLYSHLRLWLLACPSTVEDSKEEEENTVPSRLESQGPPASSFTHYEYLCALQQMARTVLCIVHVLYPPQKKHYILISLNGVVQPFLQLNLTDFPACERERKDFVCV